MNFQTIVGSDGEINPNNDQRYEKEFVNDEGLTIKYSYQGNTFTASVIKKGKTLKNVPVKIDPRWLLEKLADAHAASLDYGNVLLLSDQPSDLIDSCRCEGYQRKKQVPLHRISVVPNNSHLVKEAIRKEFQDGYVEFATEKSSIVDAEFFTHSNILNVIAWVKENRNLEITEEKVTVGHGTITHQTEGFVTIPLPSTYIGFAGWTPFIQV